MEFLLQQTVVYLERKFTWPWLLWEPCSEQRDPGKVASEYREAPSTRQQSSC